eukprot:scaffold106767_cov69-Phaeocystis_antarctica.AAC.3
MAMITSHMCTHLFGPRVRVRVPSKRRLRALAPPPCALRRRARGARGRGPVSGARWPRAGGYRLSRPCPG